MLPGRRPTTRQVANNAPMQLGQSKRKLGARVRGVVVPKSVLFRETLARNQQQSSGQIRAQTQSSLCFSSMSGSKAHMNQRRQTDAPQTAGNTFEAASRSAVDYSMHPRSPYVRKNGIRDKIR